MDKIFINDLEVYAKHGVFEAEKTLGQKFLICANLYFNTKIAGLSDELSGSIDYGSVCHYITDFMKTHTYNLIEAAAEYLARNLLLKYSPLLQAVDITIKKPWAPIGLPIESAGVSISRKWHTAYLSIGSNMGDRKKYLKDAVAALKKHKLCRVTKQSDIIETQPYGNVEQDFFLNGALEVKTLLAPAELLLLCNELEAKAERVRDVHWGPRTLDIDILFYDDEIISLRQPDLCIPHVDLVNREFVLRPLDQIAPAFVHPMYQKTVRNLFEELKTRVIRN